MQPNYERAERAALDLLEEFDCQEPGIDNLEKVTNAFGVNVSCYAFGREVSDIAAFFNVKKNTIYINKNQSGKKQELLVACQLGHIILHGDWVNSSEYEVWHRTDIDEFANWRKLEAYKFAANLLVPQFMLKQYIGFTSFFSLDYLSAEFCVPRCVVKKQIDAIRQKGFFCRVIKKMKNLLTILKC